MDLRRVYDEFILDRRGREAALTVYDTHHITPRCIGGSNEHANLIRLSHGDHLFAHILLARIHGGKLIVVAARMCSMGKYRGKHSRERYDGLRRLHRGLMRGNKHRAGAVVGEETRARLSAARARQTIGPRHRARIAAANRGNQHGRNPTPETRAKMSAAMRGKKNHLGKTHSPETRARLAELARGRKMSEDAKAALSSAMRGNQHLLGHKHSPETRAKMSESQRRRHRPKS